MSVDRPGARFARLRLDAAHVAEARGLLDREQQCYGLFDFAIDAAGDELVIDVRVPPPPD